jgi:hypothetical protein
MIKMEKNCTYYWDKIAKAHFQAICTDMSDMLNLAVEYLSKDELEHLNELLSQ